MNEKGKMGNFENPKNGTVTGQSNLTVPFFRSAKTHQDYWKSRIIRRLFATRDGKQGIPPEYSVRMRHLKHDVWFNLETANQAVAAGQGPRHLPVPCKRRMGCHSCEIQTFAYRKG
ncbi:hypothetical protein [Geminisphaera colitermitum]|uniref:hypothetical protein n=1 Tax=Geminisphaera colitermitum TaxID=1148786 RepID=UPI0001964E4B|nr:hypothetical protein [Geminisphaera colitermitum]